MSITTDLIGLGVPVLVANELSFTSGNRSATRMIGLGVPPRLATVWGDIQIPIPDQMQLGVPAILASYITTNVSNN